NGRGNEDAPTHLSPPSGSGSRSGGPVARRATFPRRQYTTRPAAQKPPPFPPPPPVFWLKKRIWRTVLVPSSVIPKIRSTGAITSRTVSFPVIGSRVTV